MTKRRWRLQKKLPAKSLWDNWAENHYLESQLAMVWGYLVSIMGHFGL